MEYNPEHTWEYNLLQNVRWDSEDVPDDVIFFVRTFRKQIFKNEIFAFAKYIVENEKDYDLYVSVENTVNQYLEQCQQN